MPNRNGPTSFLHCEYSARHGASLLDLLRRSIDEVFRRSIRRSCRQAAFHWGSHIFCPKNERVSVTEIEYGNMPPHAALHLKSRSK